MALPASDALVALGVHPKMDLKALHEAVAAAHALAGKTRVMTRVENLSLKDPTQVAMRLA